MDVMPGIGILLFFSSFIVFGVAVARMPGLPKLGGIGLAVSLVLFAVGGDETHPPQERPSPRL